MDKHMSETLIITNTDVFCTLFFWKSEFDPRF